MYYKINGEFICQTCGLEVPYCRVYTNTLEVTWKCSNLHLSKVEIGLERGY